MKTSMKTLLTTSILALAAGHVVAMNGGTVVALDQIPTTGAVYIENAGHHHCSGTLLAPTWVITARHCVLPTAFGFGTGGDTRSAPANQTAAANTAMATATGRIILGGWTADKGHDDLKTRRAAVTGLKASGEVDPDFGGGTVAIAVPDPTVTYSEVNHVMQVPDSADIIAVGAVRTSAGSRMLIARLTGYGQPVGTPWPVPASGAPGTLALVPGTAVRATAAGSNIVVAGTVVGADGVPRWTALKLDLGGHVLPFTPPFGTFTAGTLLDVVTVGSHLVWLGTLHDRGDTRVMQTTDFAGNAEGPMVTVSTSAVPIPSRLRAHVVAATPAITEVWVGGTDLSETSARIARYSIPAGTAAPGWPAAGAAMTPAPDLNAELDVRDLGEDAAGNLIVVGAWMVEKRSHAMIARFTGAGAADAGFAQSGVVITLDQTTQRADALVVMPSSAPSPAPYVVIGRQGVGKNDSMWAGGVTDHSEVSPGMNVMYASQMSTVKRIVMHPEPDADIALIELDHALTDAAGVRIAGIEARTIDELVDATVKCRGYGLNEHDETGELHIGVFTLDGTTSDGYGAVQSTWPTMIRGGDSGGGCVLEHDGGSYLLGVISSSDEREKPAPGSDDTATYGFFTDSSRFSQFIGQYVPH